MIRGDNCLIMLSVSSILHVCGGPEMGLVIIQYFRWDKL